MDGPLETKKDAGTRQVSWKESVRDLLQRLRLELAGFRVSASPFCPDFSLDQWLNAVSACSLIKENARRRVYFLQTPDGGYFLKCSMLVRRKDRRRHFLLPARKWAEWRNLHRLRKAGIAAARPIARGYRKKPYPAAFFLLTEQAPGVPIKLRGLAQAHRLGEYAARLHAAGVYHADLNRNNLLAGSDMSPCLIDVQEVFFLPWMPHRLRVHNLGNLIFHLAPLEEMRQWTDEFLQAYNRRWAKPVSLEGALRSVQYHRQRRYRSRSKRCRKNSGRFEIIDRPGLRGFKRRDFDWGLPELQRALKQAKILKSDHVLVHRDVCIKQHRRKFFHRDRCLTSWKMSQALAVRGIRVPRALGYYTRKQNSWFLSTYLTGSLHLNDYLSTLAKWEKKRQALKNLALFVKKCHANRIWQRDFKSSNLLYCNGEYFMVDLDAVKIQQLDENKKIVNLAQLNASLSNAVTIKDRLRFFYYYSAGRLSTRQQRRAVYRKVWEISRTKNTAIFNLDLDNLRPAMLRTAETGDGNSK